MTSSTWRELETDGKFDKNKKLDFVKDDTLIVGCDIGSETHYIRAIDIRGRELSQGILAFDNNSEGFEDALSWALLIATQYGKTQIVLGLELTGYYWFFPRRHGCCCTDSPVPSLQSEKGWIDNYWE